MSKPTKEKDRDGFTFYRSFRDAVEMTDKNDQLVLYKAIADYALDGIEPDVSALGALGRLCWTAISPSIKSGIKNFRNGCGGGAPKGNRNATKQPKNNPNSTEKQPAETTNVNENGNVYENENKNESINADKPHRVATERTAFVAPSLEMAIGYFATIGCTARDAESFCDYYASNGWKIGGKTPMKDWQAAARQWNRRQAEFDNTKSSTTHETQPRYQAL